MDNIQWLIFLLTVFSAGLIQGISGFGSALVAMPILAGLIGVRSAAPLVALIGLAIEIILVIRYRHALQLRVVWRLSASAAIFIPIGVWSLDMIDEHTSLRILGLVVMSYAIYALLKFKLPKLEHPGWAFLAGAVAGLVGGAYNTVGPPVILYGDCRRWPRDTFKGNLQGFFAIMSLWVAINHGISGNITPLVWNLALVSVLAVVAGIWVGLKVENRLSQDSFRVAVLVLLLFLGLRLML